ncbi:glycoside hydrolase [Amphibacillus sp. Q70]|uniref:glycoside hydrolase n=1 Tax=Amphibacillus sp. Q70 TaxID=3453416 RepID=UPI003F877FCD
MKKVIKENFKKSIVILSILVLFLGFFTPVTEIIEASNGGSSTADKTIMLDPSYQHDPFEGWGTALVWFGNQTGTWPEEIKTELADAIFGEEGLDFNIARYNIGGEDAPETEPYMRLGGAVPGYWNRPDEFGPPEDLDEDEIENWTEEEDWWNPEDPTHWDWEKDAGQQWWLKAAQERGANLFEAFSNSAPYFMTKSGYTSGNDSSTQDNLQEDQYENFAIYLTKVVEHLENELGVPINTLSPVNEPNTNYWSAGGRQEGSHWSPSSQAKIINTVADQLDGLDVDTIVSAMDETNTSTFLNNWNAYNEETKANIGQMNTHTYGTGQEKAIRDIAKFEDKRLWMSEVDLGPGGIPQDFEDIRPALHLADRITTDINNLEPKAWVLWQAIEDEVNMNADNENMNWGLIHVDFEPEDFDSLEFYKNKKYYAMGNYSKFIRPGHQIINTDDDRTLAAIDKDSNEAVVIHTNWSENEQTIDIDLSGFENAGNVATPYVTSEIDNLVQKDKISIEDDTLTVTVAPNSINTFVIDNVSGVSEDAGFLNPDTRYNLINVNSDLALDAADDSVVQNSVDRGNTAQEWQLEKVTDGYTHEEVYKIVNAKTDQVITNDDGTAVLAEDVASEAQEWILSTNGNGQYSFINKEAKRVLEIGDESRAEGVSAGLWRPNAGNHQAWYLEEAGVQSVETEFVWTLPGVAPDLPDEVTVVYGDGKTDTKLVEWAELDEEQYASENIFVLEGTVEDTNIKAELDIYVSEIRSIIMTQVKTVPGLAPTLPEEVAAQLNVGKKIVLPVEWEDIDPALYETLGSFTITGSVDHTDIDAEAYIKVTEPSIENIALNTDGSDYPEAKASFSGRWDPVENINDGKYDERWTNWDADEWRSEDWVEIDFGEEKTLYGVDFTFYDDHGGTRPPETLHLEYWDEVESDWVKIADTSLEIDTEKEVSIEFPEINTSRIRSVMTAMPDACIAILEMEVIGLSNNPALGDNALLESILVDGTALEDFTSDTFDYHVELPADTTEVPEISVVTEDPFANYDIELPTSLTDKAVITVISEDETVKETYTIDFSVAEQEVNKSVLAAEVKRIRALDADQYTEESWALLTSALAKAEGVLADDEATEAEVEDALAALKSAVQGLEEAEESEDSKVDKSSLAAEVKRIQKLDAKQYTEESWASLATVLAKAEDVLADDEATQQDVDEILKALQTAVENLQKVADRDTDDPLGDNDEEAEDPKDPVESTNGEELPDTATNTYNWITLGLLMVLVAVGIYGFSKTSHLLKK